MKLPPGEHEAFVVFRMQNKGTENGPATVTVEAERSYIRASEGVEIPVNQDSLELSRRTDGPKYVVNHEVLVDDVTLEILRRPR